MNKAICTAHSSSGRDSRGEHDNYQRGPTGRPAAVNGDWKYTYTPTVQQGRVLPWKRVEEHAKDHSICEREASETLPKTILK